MSNRSYAVFLQVTGFSLFLILAVVLLFFADGYLYDAEGRNFVKNGLVYIEDFDPQEIQVHVNGKPYNMVIPGEIRMPPGKHLITLTKVDHYIWNKLVTFPEDDVLKIPKVVLLPKVLPKTKLKAVANLFQWKPQLSAQDGLFLVNEKLHTGIYYPYSNASKAKIYEIPFISNSLVYLSGSTFLVESKPGSFEERDLREKKPNSETNEVLAFKRIFESQGTLFALDPDGNLQKRGALNEFNSLLPAFSNARGVVTSGEYIALLHEIENSPSLVITNSAGKIILTSTGAYSPFFDESKVSYIQDDHEGQTIQTFDLEKLQVSASTVKKGLPMVWISRIGKTSHMLALTKDKVLNYCDLDLENCHTLFTLDDTWMDKSEDALVYALPVNGTITLLNLREDGRFDALLQEFGVAL